MPHLIQSSSKTPEICVTLLRSTLFTMTQCLGTLTLLVESIDGDSEKEQNEPGTRTVNDFIEKHAKDHGYKKEEIIFYHDSNEYKWEECSEVSLIDAGISHNSRLRFDYNIREGASHPETSLSQEPTKLNGGTRPAPTSTGSPPPQDHKTPPKKDI